MLLRQRDIEYLKNEQAMKWRIILLELIKLRHEGKMPDQIDRIIT